MQWRGQPNKYTQNDTMSNNQEPRLLEHHPWLMVRLSSSTVAAGIFLSLCLWALYDMRFVQRRKTIFLVKLSYFACQLNTVTMYKLLYMQFRIIKPICLYMVAKINSRCLLATIADYDPANVIFGKSWRFWWLSWLLFFPVIISCVQFEFMMTYSIFATEKTELQLFL